MKAGLAVFDGVRMPLDQACIPVTDPAVAVGWSVFESIRVEDGEVPHLDAHLDRLTASCEATFIPPPDRAVLSGEILGLARESTGLARVRVTLTGGGRRIVSIEPADETRIHRPVRAVRGPHRDEPFLGGSVKHGSRAPWIVAVKRSGVDEVLLVADGRFTEATTAAILAVIGGVLYAHPEDGRILESTTRAALLRRAADLGIPTRLEGAPSEGPWDGLYVASALRDLAPVVELDGVALPAWEPVGRALIANGPES